MSNTKEALAVTNNLGAVYVQSGQYKQAIDALSKAKSLADKLGDKKEIASALYQLGVAYANYGNNSEAQKNFEASKEIAQAQNLTALIASIDKSMSA